MIASVGTPPDQKNASILPAPSAAADSATPSRVRSGSTPATSSIRSATTSVPESGEPTLTRFPCRSSSVRMPASGVVTSCT